MVSLGACRRTCRPARERDIFSTDKDDEAGDIECIVDTAGCRQTEKGPLEARSGFSDTLLEVQSSRKGCGAVSPPDTRWVCEYEPLVAACCRGLGLNADQVEEATAETLLAALKGASTYDGRASRATWLWRIAYFQAINVLRRQGRDQTKLTLHEDYVEYPQPEPWQQLAQAERVRCLSAALQQLPTPWAAAIRQYYWQYKSTREIAETMKVTSQAVRVYLFRGRHRLRDLLGEDLAGI